jgi:hypothetical protein
MAGAIPLHGLLDRVQQRLGRYIGYYDPEEIVLNGLSPAQNLLVLLDPSLLTKRVAVSVAAQGAFIDLRSAAPRVLSVQRVVLGTLTADDPQTSLGQIKDLKYTDRTSLTWQRDWFRHTGVPSYWYMQGRYLLGLYKRALDSLTLTLIYRAMPTPFNADEQDAVSELPIITHPVISDIAALVLQVKEGQIEAQRAIAQLGEILGEEYFAPARRALAALQRQASAPMPAAPAPAPAPGEAA